MFQAAYTPCPDYHPATVRAALEAALSQVTDFAWLKPGMTVALKVNLIAALHPEKAATTHPAVVCAMCDILTERGAKVVVGDSPGGTWNAAWVERSYKVSGLLEVEDHGAVLNRDYAETHVTDKSAKLCREFDVTAWLTHADAVISLCKLKTHGMMTLTAGVKNMFGSIPGAKKPEYHFRFPDHADFADALVDIFHHFSPVLTVCDGVMAMEGNGPTAGSPHFVGYLAAATNAHLLDYSLAQVIGLEPLAVPTVAAAKARGLLPEHIPAHIFGQPPVVPDFVLPKGDGMLFEGQGGAFGRLRSKILGKALQTRPQLTPEKCVGCQECYKVCPAKAITMKKNRPVIDRKACIRCFCCQEFCPQGALHVHRNLIGRLFNKEVS